MSVPYIPKGYPPVMPYLVVKEPEKILDFAVKVFGAEVIEKITGPDGRVNHCEFRLDSSVVMAGLSMEENPPVPCYLYVYVPDVDAAFQRALDQGATATVELRNEFYGDRVGGVKDDQGITWWFATHVEDVSPEELNRRMMEAQKQG